MSHDATNLSFKNNVGKPKLFSLNNHRGLESKRTNVYLDSSANNTPQTSHKTPSLLLTSLLSNPPRAMTPNRPMSPNRPRLSDMSFYPSNSGIRDFSGEPNSERAYNQPKLSRLTARSTEIRFSPEPTNGTQNPETLSLAHSNHDSSNFAEDGQRYKSPEPVTRNKRLKEDNSKLLNLYTQASRDLDDCQSKLEDVMAQSKDNALELKQLRPALASTRETLAAKEAELSSLSLLFSETKSALSDLRHKYAALTEAFNKETVERQRLETVTTHLKASLGQISASHSELAEAFKELKKGDNTSTKQFRDLVDEVAETKKLARNGLFALEPLLNDQNNLARAAQTKETLKELSDALSSSQQVNDILRDKLFNMSSELCIAQQRIKELEDEKRGELQQLLKMKVEERAQFRSFADVEGNLTELSEKLAVRETETINSLARAAALEVELESAKAQLQSSKTVQEKLCSELQALRTDKDENMSTILALQNTINTRDKELISLKADVKALTESKAELRALLAESKKDLSQKMQELESRNPNLDLIEKIKELEATNAVLQHDLHEFKNKHVEMLNSHQGLEIRIRGKLHEAEKANIETLSRNSSLEESLKEMRRELEKCRKLKDDLKSESKNTSDRLCEESQQLKERLDVQSVHLFQSKEECSALKERLNALLNQLSMTQSALTKAENTADLMAKLQEKSASDSEAITNGLRVRLESTTAELEAVTFKLEEAEVRLKSAKEASTLAEQVNMYESSEQAKMDHALIAKLERKNAELVEASVGILTRYNSGLLTEIEKKFVGHLMDEAERIHAEGVAKKDNELRRRQLTVDDLKAKNAELQAALARLLKEKAGQPGIANKSIVALKNWVSSSPVQNEAQGSETHVHKEALTVTSIPHMPAPTSILREPAQPSGPGKYKGSESSHFHDNVDSDDDIPLSELNLLSEDVGEGGKGSGNKRSRPQSPPAVEEPNQTKRRTRIPLNPPQEQPPAVSPVSKRKTSETHATKTKQKKRK